MTAESRVVRDRSRLISVRRVAVIVALTAAWCALWRSASAANVLSGLVVSSVASGAGVNAASGVRLLPLLRLFWVVSVDLAVSTAVVVREVLTPTDYTDEAIIAVPIPVSARRHLLFLYIAITVTPGTAVVAGDDDREDGTALIYLHVLHDDRRDDVVEHVELLVSLVTRAFPSAMTAEQTEVVS